MGAREPLRVRVSDELVLDAGIWEEVSESDGPERHASRLFANALVNVAWRNGPVEDVHAGRFRGYPLDMRRVTPDEERELMRFASDGMASGMTTCHRLAADGAGRSWPEQVLPYGLAGPLLVTPSGWTITETSREVRLPSFTAVPSESDRGRG